MKRINVPGSGIDFKCFVATTEEEVNNIVQSLYERTKVHPVVGVDCEWNVCRLKGQKPLVALLQIGAPDGFCGLIRTGLMKELPKSLIDFMKDANILKVGIGIYQDEKYLADKYGAFSMRGKLDIRVLTRYMGIQQESLEKLTDILELPFYLPKNRKKLQQWEWCGMELSTEMIKYAALDAVAGAIIFEQLMYQLKDFEECKKNRQNIRGTDPRELMKELFWEIFANDIDKEFK